MTEAKPRAPRKAPVKKEPAVLPSNPSSELVLAVDALRSASLAIHRTKHQGSYEQCPETICARANVLWEELGGAMEVSRLLPAAEDWLLMRVIPVAPTAELDDAPEFTRTEQKFEGEVVPNAPPMVIAKVSESRRDADDEGIPRGWKRINLNTPEAL